MMRMMRADERYPTASAGSANCTRWSLKFSVGFTYVREGIQPSQAPVVGGQEKDEDGKLFESHRAGQVPPVPIFEVLLEPPLGLVTQVFRKGLMSLLISNMHYSSQRHEGVQHH